MQMKWSMFPLALIAVVGISTTPLFGQETKEADQDKNEQQKKETDVDDDDDEDDEDELTLASVQKEYNKAYSEFMKAYRAEKDPVKKRALVAEMLPSKEDYVEKVFKLVNADPSSEDSWKALMWLNAGLRKAESRKKVMEVILEYHIESEQLANMVMAMSRTMDQESVDNLNLIIKKNPHNEVKGKAAMALVTHYGMVDRYLGDKDILERIKASPGSADLYAYLTGLKKDEVKKKVNALIEEIKDKYGDVEYRGNITLGDKAEAYIFERDRLQVGMEVPDIEAEDVDGAEFKLSEYRGKIVFLDFWGDW